MKPIRDDADYREVLEELDRLAGAIEDSPEDDLLAVLSALAAAYEAEQGR